MTTTNALPHVGNLNACEPRTVPVVLMRGGTSKGVFIHEHDLPPIGPERDRLLLELMGSPDPMQIDGLGGTHSSTSKVMVIGRSDEPGIDIRYWFAQVDIDQPIVDTDGNCGNLTTAVAPFAIDEGLVDAVEPLTRVRLKNTNTGVVVDATVPVHRGRAQVTGELSIPGVPGSGAPIGTDYRNPGGGVLGRTFPTGETLDTVATSFGEFPVSILDVTHPMAFVDAAAFGLALDGTRTSELNADTDLLQRAEELRGACAVSLGTVTDWRRAAEESATVPNLVFVEHAPADSECDIRAVAVSMGKFHHALPVTAALCLAAAANISGTVPAQHATTSRGAELRIRHPKGIIIARADVDAAASAPIVRSVGVTRTARRLLAGTAYLYPTSRVQRTHTDHRGPQITEPEESMNTDVGDAVALPDGAQITLRAALKEDLPAIVDLLVDDPLGRTRDGATSDEGYGPYERAFAEITTDPNQHLLVATDDGAIVATFQLTFISGLSRRGARRAQIEGVRVAQRFRSRGLGAAMIRWAIDEAAKRGCTLVQLTSDKTRGDAHRFYERLGFQPTHEGYKLRL